MIVKPIWRSAAARCRSRQPCFAEIHGGIRPTSAPKWARSRRARTSVAEDPKSKGRRPAIDPQRTTVTVGSSQSARSTVSTTHAHLGPLMIATRQLCSCPRLSRRAWTLLQQMTPSLFNFTASSHALMSIAPLKVSSSNRLFWLIVLPSDRTARVLSSCTGLASARPTFEPEAP